MKMNRRQHIGAAVLAAAILPVHHAMADKTKADNATNLDLGGSWVGTIAPSTGDLAIWTGTYNTSGALNANFSTSAVVSWSGIQIGATSGSQTSSGLISIGGTGTAATG